MKRLLSTTAAALAFTVAATGCGIAKDDTAATVDGTNISFDDVKALSKVDEIKGNTQGMVSPGEGSIGSASLRSAVNQLISLEAIEAWVNDNGGVTDEDRDLADQERPASSDETFNKFLDRYYPVNIALARIAGELSESDPDTLYTESFDLLRPLIGSLYCVDLVQLDGDRADFEALVGKNGSLADVDIDDLSGVASPIFDAEECVTSLDLQGVTDQVDDAPVGEWTYISFDANGQTIEVFVKKESVRQATAQDEAVHNIIDQLTSDPQYFAQAMMSGILASADVTVDPRLGTWSIIGGGTIAPTVPLVPVSPAPEGFDAETLAELEAMMGSQQ